ncbi:hypothetical protein DICVIV_05882 [Dictyocaulus viviparus]|uniref:Uncharacterized protein n=1 Tax=Dictyocaulus viviparus TaxID=29172 RepID=A0A0D8XW42_DICVI|nr:hypothetical protein DICVIV_05882 [Dictyocaulus viviparus]
MEMSIDSHQLHNPRLIDDIVVFIAPITKQGKQTFYTIAIDIVSLLTTLACACRLPIYLICQVTLRQEVKEAVCKLCCCLKHQSKNSKYRTVSKPRNTFTQCSVNGTLQNLVTSIK